MIRRIFAVTALCLGTAAAVHASDLGDKRHDEMKKNGASISALVGIAKGEKPYDAATVKTALETISTTIKAFPDLFPADNPDDDGKAKPTIWDNMADFKAKANKLGADADALLADLPADQAAVGSAVKTIGALCSSCHEKYRLKR